jgi:hypothetical protein
VISDTDWLIYIHLSSARAEILEFYPPRGPFGPTQPEPRLSSNMLPVPNLSPSSFFPARMKPDLFTICPDYRIINICFF